MGIVQNLTHIEDAIALLLTQFRDKPLIQAFITSHATQIQAIEDAMIDVMLLRMLENATGQQLDRIGRLVGEAKRDRDETDFKAAISRRIRINRSHGRTEDIILILKLTHDAIYEVTDQGNAKIRARLQGIWSASLPSLAEFTEALQLSKPGGVKADFQYQTVAEGNIFQFSDTDVIETSSLQGFADDSQTTGGNWSDII